MSDGLELRAGDCIIDTINHRIVGPAGAVALTVQELRILCSVVCTESGIEMADLVRRVWSHPDATQRAAYIQSLKRLRRKLRAIASEYTLINRRGRVSLSLSLSRIGRDCRRLQLLRAWGHDKITATVLPELKERAVRLVQDPRAEY